MKKIWILAVTASLLLTGCGTYAGSGAYMGGSLGAILGSAVGGLSDGPRGSDIGTIVGMAGGAIIGGMIGAAQDEQCQQEAGAYERERAERAADRAERAADRAERRQSAPYGSQSPVQDSPAYDSGFDSSNSGDDRIYDFSSSDYTGDYSAQQPQTTLPMQSSMEGLAEGLKYAPTIEIRNARFVDDNQDGQIQRGELCKIIFEVMNRGDQPLYDVQPTVIEATGNRHLFISPSMHIEKIMPGKGIRYTALVKANNRLKAGSAKFCVSVLQGTQSISKVSEFNIPTRK
ncbi:hypothetical protein [Hallella seregens]|uniref:Glycine zipper domain-containing protein n=1 Tax=Hallella seregens ATCC 51272 TaxID=1336250 RepID=A0ABV5ZML1_9BACT|nr:hypothetical protein [Hallella seregens]